MAINWQIISELITYEESINLMNSTLQKVMNNLISDTIIIFSCYNVYTYTKNCSTKEISFNNREKIPLIETNRGGKLTYHGPGQRIVYPVLNLNNYKKDIKWYIEILQKWIINTLDEIGIKSFKSDQHIGIWCKNSTRLTDAKIASIGVRLTKWITTHGFCVNLYPNLKYFDKISPCGILNCKVTSCKEIGYDVSYDKFDNLLKTTFCKSFVNTI